MPFALPPLVNYYFIFISVVAIVWPVLLRHYCHHLLLIANFLFLHPFVTISGITTTIHHCCHHHLQLIITSLTPLCCLFAKVTICHCHHHHLQLCILTFLLAIYYHDCHHHLSPPPLLSLVDCSFLHSLTSHLLAPTLPLAAATTTTLVDCNFLLPYAPFCRLSPSLLSWSYLDNE